MEENRVCFPACESFRCDQRSLMRVGKRIYCRWAEDDCVGPSCNYAVCIRGRMLPSKICGLTVKRKTEEKTFTQVVKGDNNIKLRAKITRRFREDDMI